MKWEFLRHRLWSRAWSVSIQTKIMGIVALGIFASVVGLVWYTYQDVTSAMRLELQRRGIAIGAGLALQSRDLILTDNLFPLYRLAQNTRDADQDVVYVYVLDTTSNVLVHTFEGGFPTGLLGKNEVPPGEPYQVRILQADDDTIQDVAVPVLGGKAGVIHLGLSEKVVNAAVDQQVRHFLIWSSLIFAIGLSGAYLLSSILTKPIYGLVEAARAVGRGDFKWRAPAWAGDEIGRLGAAFDKMGEELKRKEELRQQLLAKVITAQEEERKRIARELHDETSQALTSLMVGLKFLADSPGSVTTKDKLAELRALAAQTLSEVHHLATELRPTLLDDLGLFAAIQKYTHEYAAQTHINVDCHLGEATGKHLSPESEVAVYRIIQEALTNVAKYAEPSNVSVILNYRDSSLVAVVEDDGKGFDVNRTMLSAGENKLGLFGMYERATLVGGQLTIESKPGEGTTIFLEVPLRGQVEDEKDKIASG